MNTNRRKFLTSTGALTAGALASNLGTWGVQSAEAQAATGYKAIVCVFLFGGNDSNNMVVPYTDYAQYSAVRTVASNVQLTLTQDVSDSGSGGVLGGGITEIATGVESEVPSSSVTVSTAV